MGQPPQIPSLIRDALDDYRARVAARFGPRLVELRLFGSYARGDWHAESDVDVLTVVEGLAGRERHDVFDLAWDVFADRLVRISPLALSSAEWRTLNDREYLLAADIAREGIAL